MNRIELGDVARLGLTAAEMRATPNRRSTHECEILDGQGLLLSRVIPLSAMHPFSSYQKLISRNPAQYERDGQ